jgi:molybdopterin-dependent oxidoreductase-like protein protein
VLAGFGELLGSGSSKKSKSYQLEKGKLLGTVEFAQENGVAMESLSGAELDGRLYTDLSGLTPEHVATPTESFYIRTRASELLRPQASWEIRLGGLVAQPFNLTLPDLRRTARPMGLHLMECSGNFRAAHFGMLSVADWTGTLVSDILDRVKVDLRAARILISGFDTFAAVSSSSVPGASWIFTPEDLKSSGAFLATEMNRQPLSKDHGHPVRLVVPGWYGCTCIKWVNEITWVDDNAETTSQMKEFAKRTHQSGVPSLARNYQPALIEQAAMPLRIEKWVMGGNLKYRCVGILWGGSRLVNVLEIKFNADVDYVPVDHFEQNANDPWSFWTHEWHPKQKGIYIIQLRVKDPPVPQRRLDAGYYARAVEITEV